MSDYSETIKIIISKVSKESSVDDLVKLTQAVLNLNSAK